MSDVTFIGAIPGEAPENSNQHVSISDPMTLPFIGAIPGEAPENSNQHVSISDPMTLPARILAVEIAAEKPPIANGNKRHLEPSSREEEEDETPLNALLNQPQKKKSKSSANPSDLEDGIGQQNGRQVGDTDSAERMMNNHEEHIDTNTGEIVSQFIPLDLLPLHTIPLLPLTKAEWKELETCLEISKADPWRDDWIGNLAFADKDVVNPDGKSRSDRGAKKTLLSWALRGKTSLKILNSLLRCVFNLSETPKQARRILASIDQTNVLAIQESIRRLSYDPVVLRQDGWTTQKSKEPIGASGGPHRIGEMVFWQGYEGVVIAYLHDHDLGDLWKAMWLEEFDTFDLEVEELEDAKKKYERRQQRQAANNEKVVKSSSSSVASTSAKPVLSAESASSRRSGRYAASADFSVKGIEHGIVHAVSFSRGSRPGVFWPARLMHASEMLTYGAQTKRGSSKQKVDVIFLAPYWNAPPIVAGGRSYAESLQRHGTSIFSTGPLFEMETIDVSEECVQPYPYDSEGGLDIDQLRVSFKFSGLPKAAFSRFVDSHRLALALKTYSEARLKPSAADLDLTTANLFEAHPMSVQTALFPLPILHLPFGDILSNIPLRIDEGKVVSNDDPQTNKEPAIRLSVIVDAMKPPFCWGQGGGNNATPKPPLADEIRFMRTLQSPPIPTKLIDGNSSAPVAIDPFIVDLPSLSEILTNGEKFSIGSLLSNSLGCLLEKMPRTRAEFEEASIEVRRMKAKDLVKEWALLKSQGEERISSSSTEHRMSHNLLLVEWRRMCERLYKYMTLALSTKGFGNGVSAILSDSLCNRHITSNGCFERPVRLPAAIKAAKEIGAGSSDKIQLITSVGERYLELAEKKVVGKAHSKTYLKRIKKKCMSVPSDEEVVPLTENSEGQGGEDTKGSKGTWVAALAGVGAAIKGVDMIMSGECVNVFCATRPPGHHAGRELHPMKAVSNGFCILNAAACAALYATTSVAEDGLGLKRVCVIDIDVHHGNGTQDILCSTYDPRFLYVSIHAGGPDVNGVAPGEVGDDLAHHLGRSAAKGIYPGRCGDTSPHLGVLNIPLGAKVTAHALGTALITKVTPRVERFSPDLIILSTGFDAHKNDPLGLGGLCAEDFGTLTEVVCQLAHKSCSGRVLSILEGGYGVPCCRAPENLFDPDKFTAPSDGAATLEQPAAAPEESKSDGVNNNDAGYTTTSTTTKPDPKLDLAIKQLAIKDLGQELPSEMLDNIPYDLMKRLDKCHQEGFMECVKKHVQTLAKCNNRT